jgi:hypothetical protein
MASMDRRGFLGLLATLLAAPRALHNTKFEVRPRPSAPIKSSGTMAKGTPVYIGADGLLHEVTAEGQTIIGFAHRHGPDLCVYFPKPDRMT